MISQGAAVMHNVIPLLAQPVKEKIVGGVLIGDTKNQQSGGEIPGFPKEKLLIICAPDDGICWGKLSVTAGHVVFVLPTFIVFQFTLTVLQIYSKWRYG
jgi:cutinase